MASLMRGSHATGSWQALLRLVSLRRPSITIAMTLMTLMLLYSTWTMPFP